MGGRGRVVKEKRPPELGLRVAKRNSEDLEPK